MTKLLKRYLKWFRLFAERLPWVVIENASGLFLSILTSVLVMGAVGASISGLAQRSNGPVWLVAFVVVPVFFFVLRRILRFQIARATPVQRVVAFPLPSSDKWKSLATAYAKRTSSEVRDLTGGVAFLAVLTLLVLTAPFGKIPVPAGVILLIVSALLVSAAVAGYWAMRPILRDRAAARFMTDLHEQASPAVLGAAELTELSRELGVAATKTEAIARKVQDLFEELKADVISRESERIKLMEVLDRNINALDLEQVKVDAMFQLQEERQSKEKRREKRRDVVFFVIGLAVALLAAPVWEIWLKPLVFRAP